MLSWDKLCCDWYRRTRPMEILDMRRGPLALFLFPFFSSERGWFKDVRQSNNNKERHFIGMFSSDLSFLSSIRRLGWLWRGEKELPRFSLLSRWLGLGSSFFLQKGGLIPPWYVTCVACFRIWHVLSLGAVVWARKLYWYNSPPHTVLIVAGLHPRNRRSSNLNGWDRID